MNRARGSPAGKSTCTYSVEVSQNGLLCDLLFKAAGKSLRLKAKDGFH